MNRIFSRPVKGSFFSSMADSFFPKSGFAVRFFDRTALLLSLFINLIGSIIQLHFIGILRQKLLQQFPFLRFLCILLRPPFRDRGSPAAFLPPGTALPNLSASSLPGKYSYPASRGTAPRADRTASKSPAHRQTSKACCFPPIHPHALRNNPQHPAAALHLPDSFLHRKALCSLQPGYPAFVPRCCPENRTHAKTRALYQKNNRHAHQHRPARKAIRQAAQL